MIKVRCKLGIHRWDKKKKQWIGSNGPIMTKRCRLCGTLKEEGKLTDHIKIWSTVTKKAIRGIIDVISIQVRRAWILRGSSADNV